jgi:hypothetical protein
LYSGAIWWENYKFEQAQGEKSSGQFRSSQFSKFD